MTTTITSKNNWFYLQTNSSARVSRFLVHFFDVHCTTSTWNHVMRHRLIQDVNIRGRIFLSFFEPWFQIILAWSSPLRRLVLSNRNIEQINYPSTAVRSALPTIISVIRFYTSVLLILIYTLPRCCLFKWIFKNCSLKNSTPGKISYICQIERALLDVIKFERTQIRFFGNVFTTLVVVASSRVFSVRSRHVTYDLLS